MPGVLRLVALVATATVAAAATAGAAGWPSSSSAMGPGPPSVEAPGAGRDAPSAAGGAVRSVAPARAAAAGDGVDRGVARWRWPVPAGSPVLRPFRAPPSPWGAGHRGLDLAGRAGAPVLAVEGGVVTHAGRLAGRGTVTVTHADGLRSTYEPVSPLVAVGQVVAVGDAVGRLEPAAGHCGARTCLHLGAVRGSGYLDPWPLLTPGRVRLLPRPP